MAIQRYRHLPCPSRSQGHGTFRPLPRLGLAGLAAGIAVAADGLFGLQLVVARRARRRPRRRLVEQRRASGSAAIPSGLGTSSFTVDIASTMSQLKPLTAAATKGASSLQVGVILPDTTSSTRYVDFDAPYLKQAFTDAGYTSSRVPHRQRAGQRRDRAERRHRRHQPGRQGPDRGRDRQPDRRGGREACRAKGRHPDRLRPCHLPGLEHLLRQLQQRARGRADRPGLRDVRQVLGDLQA